MNATLLPVFPLDVVLLPEEVLSLHIFEERYKQMINTCLEAKARHSEHEEFGVVLIQDERIELLGCTARILRVVRKYRDGRMDILTMGARRFKILYTNDDQAYLRCGVDFFDDAGPDTPAESDAARAIDLFRQATAQLHPSSESPLEFERPYRYLSFRIAASLPLESDFKQHLLSLRREAERLEKVERAMSSLIERFQLSRRTKEKSRGNGNLRHGVN